MKAKYTLPSSARCSRWAVPQAKYRPQVQQDEVAGLLGYSYDDDEATRY